MILVNLSKVRKKQIIVEECVCVLLCVHMFLNTCVIGHLPIILFDDISGISPGHVRLRELCDRLDITDEELQRMMWTCMEHVLVKHVDLHDGQTPRPDTHVRCLRYGKGNDMFKLFSLHFVKN